MMKKILLSVIVCILCNIGIYAHDFVVDGIYYNITNTTDMTVEVTYKGELFVEMDFYYGEIEIPTTVAYKGETYQVTAIGKYAFSGMGISAITLPLSITTIGDYAFLSCFNLKSIVIPAHVTTIGAEIFSNCSSLRTIEVDNKNSLYDSREACNAIIETATNTLIVACNKTVIPTTVSAIGDLAFSGCTEMTTITIPNNITSIGRSAFCCCVSLTEINIPGSVTNIGNFAFDGCMSITSITIPHTVTTIGSGLFSDCISLTDVVVEEGNSIYDSRESCNAVIESATNTLIAGCNNTCIPSDIVAIGDNAFYMCSGLSSIKLPESILSIGAYAFYSCADMTKILIPENVTLIDEYAFSLCYNMTEINIPNSVVSIGQYAFAYCDGLRRATIGSNIATIYDYAFGGCTGLKKIEINATTPPAIYANTFLDVKRSITLTVPYACSDKYRVADYWCEFSNIEEKEGTSIDNITTNNIDGRPQYYDINGRQVSQPQQGIYIKKQRNIVSKVVM